MAQSKNEYSTGFTHSWRNGRQCCPFSAKGEPSVIFEMTNPVQQLCTDAERYMLFQDGAFQILLRSSRRGYALKKQDVLLQAILPPRCAGGYLRISYRGYFKYFEGEDLPRNLHLQDYHTQNFRKPVHCSTT